MGKSIKRGKKESEGKKRGILLQLGGRGLYRMKEGKGIEKDKEGGIPPGRKGSNSNVPPERGCLEKRQRLHCQKERKRAFHCRGRVCNAGGGGEIIPQFHYMGKEEVRGLHNSGGDKLLKN